MAVLSIELRAQPGRKEGGKPCKRESVLQEKRGASASALPQISARHVMSEDSKVS